MAFGDQPPIIRKDSSDTELNPAKSFLIIFMSVMNVFMFFGNILSLVTIGSTFKLRHQVSYWFVMNLAVIDLLISVTVVPLNIIWEYYGTWPFNKETCEFFTFADIAFSTISAYSIVLVSIDKYCYIYFSIQYFDKMTRKLAVILIITVWISVFIFTTVSILTELGTDNNFKDHFLTIANETQTCIFVMTDTFVIPSTVISFFLPFGILCFTSSRIVCIASKHIRKIHTISNSLTSDTDSEMLRMARTRARGNTPTGSTTPASTSTRVNQQNTIKFSKSPLAKTVTHSTVLEEDSKEDQESEHREEQANTNKYHDISITVNNGCGHFIQTQFDVVDQPLQNGTDKTHHSTNILQNTTNKPQNISDQIQNCTDKEQAGTDLLQNGTDKMSYTENDPRALTSSKRSNSTCSNKTLSNIHIQTEIEANSQKTDPSPPIKKRQQIQRLRSQSIKSTISRSDSLRSNILKPTESMKSIGTIKKGSPYCKLFGTVTIVIACFILMFAPYNIAIIVDIGCHCIEPWVYEDVLAVLYYMHSLVNPYIYMATDRKYKAALRDLWQRIKKKTPWCETTNTKQEQMF